MIQKTIVDWLIPNIDEYKKAVCRERSRRWREEHPKYNITYNKKYNKENLQKKLEYNRKYRKIHSKRDRDWHIKWATKKHNGSKMISCACGCGELIHEIGKTGYQISRFKYGHNRRRGETRSHGYVYKSRPNHPFCSKANLVPEHRLVWEECNNAILLPWAHVHHINRIRDDNRIENLKAMTKWEHCSLTTRVNMKQFKVTWTPRL